MKEEQHPAENDSANIPKGQIWFDRIFLLLILSIVITGLIYNVWGMIELFVIR